MMREGDSTTTVTQVTDAYYNMMLQLVEVERGTVNECEGRQLLID